MSLGEFDLIERYFRLPAERLRVQRGDVPLGIGDDAALLSLPPGRQLVAALDTLVEGTHFPPGAAPASIGHRALAVNLSDLAAMGATPAWYLLALTLPRAEAAFLEEFARGLLQLGDQHGMALVGGDTTRGSLVVSVQALGTVANGAALTRSGGRPGDLLYVSGTPGDCAAGLALLLDPAAGGPLAAAQRRYLQERFLYPTPRVALGQALAGLASACIDVSDGLAADAQRLARASGCAAQIDAGQLPLSRELLAFADESAARRLALTGGEDCELCFSLPPGKVAALEAALDSVKCGATCIGRLATGDQLEVSLQGRALPIDARGYDHFEPR
jgi:thiamine-monophosphate kinase